MRTGGYGGSSRRSFGALGDDVNLAARLMSRAVPGEVLVSRRVHKELSDESEGGANFFSEGFTFEPREPIRLKGKAEPIPIFAIQLASSSTEQFAFKNPLTPFRWSAGKLRWR